MSSEDPSSGDSGNDLSDPLLSCLLNVIKHEGKLYSATALLAGLPLVNNRLTPDLFVRAAERANLAATVVKRELSDISNLVLPAILLLEDDNASVLMHFDRGTNKAQILDNDSGEPVVIELSHMAEQYTGYAIYLRTDYEFDQRSELSGLRDHRHWFWSVIAQSWRIYRDVLLASFLINLFAIATPLFVMNVYDRVVPNRAFETLWVLAIGIVIVFMFDVSMKIIRGYFIELAGRKSDVLLSATIFEKVLGLQLTHRAASVGTMANYLREFEAVKSFITTSTITTLVDIPFVCLFLLVIAFIGGSLVWVPLSLIPLSLATGFIMQKPLRRYIENSFQAATQKNSALIESLTAIETVKSLGVEGKLQTIWESVVGKVAFWGQRSRVLSTSVVNIAAFFQQMATVLVVVYGVYLISDSALSMGGLIACVMLTGRALAPLGQIANLQVSYFHAKTSLNALNQIMVKPAEREHGKTFLHHPRLDGKIEFRHVSFNYPDQERDTLHNINFSIAPGEKVAIIGRIGSGKSTLLKMVLGLYAPSKGSILIDNIDIGQLDPSDLRSDIGYVAQDVLLFYGTLRDNLTYANRDASDQDVIDAVNQSGMADFVRRFPKGLDFIVGERGELLSGGQRQSVGFARAMIGKPNVFLFDEPTSQMDNSSEGLIKQSIESLSEDKTLLLVTHKTSMLSLVDRVIVLDHGAVVIDGPRHDVLEALRLGKVQVQRSTDS